MTRTRSTFEWKRGGSFSSRSREALVVGRLQHRLEGIIGMRIQSLASAEILSRVEPRTRQNTMTGTCTEHETVFLDTGYVIALEAADDQHHEDAADHWREVGPRLTSIVTTTYVFDEVVTFFNGRDRHAKAVEIGRRLRLSRRVEVVTETEALFQAAWDRFQGRPRARRRPVRWPSCCHRGPPA